MKYELWEVYDFDETTMQAIILNKTFENFTDAYIEFQKLIKTTPCCIILNNNMKKNPKINDLIYSQEKKYGKIVDIKINEKFYFKEIIFDNYVTNKKEVCYEGDLRIIEENKWEYMPTGV